MADNPQFLERQTRRENNSTASPQKNPRKHSSFASTSTGRTSDMTPSPKTEEEREKLSVNMEELMSTASSELLGEGSSHDEGSVSSTSRKSEKVKTRDERPDVPTRRLTIEEANDGRKYVIPIFKEDDVDAKNQKPVSMRSIAEDSSYGSLSLGGDDSLSTIDTFNNSPIHIYRKPVYKRKKSNPDLAATPTRSLLKVKESPKPVRKKYIPSDDESSLVSSSSASSEGSDKFMTASASSFESGDTLSSCSLRSDNYKAKTSFKKRNSAMSTDSGDVSIATISEDGYDTGESRSASLSTSMSQNTSDISGAPSNASSKKSKSKSKGSQKRKDCVLEASSMRSIPEDDLAPENVDVKNKNHASWKNDENLKIDDWKSVSTGGDTWVEDMKDNNNVSWKNNKNFQLADWKSCSTASDFNLEDWKSASTGVGSTWTSGSSLQGSIKERSSLQSSIKERTRSVPPLSTEKNEKPRSAYDKNAPWYSGDDDDGSDSEIASDLSEFRKKKNKSQTHDSQSSGSVSLSGLGSEASISLSSMQHEQSDPGNTLLNSKPLDELSVDTSPQSSPLNQLSPINESKRSLLEHPMPSSTNQSRQIEESGVDNEEDGESGEFSSEEKENAGNALASPRLRLLLFIGLFLFLVFDVILLSLWLSRRGDDGDPAPVENAVGAAILATVPKTICWDWVPGQGKSKLCTPADTASGGGVANLVAKAIKVTSPEPVDISLIPAGLTHADIPEGGFTLETVEAVTQPQSKRRLLRKLNMEGDTSLVTLQGTGGKILQVLESAIDFALYGQSSSYPYASGLRFSVDSTALVQERIISPVIFVDEAWVPLESEKEYTVVTTREWAIVHWGLQGRPTNMNPLAALTEYARQEQVLETPEFSTREFLKDEGGNTLNENSASDDTNSKVIATVAEDICLEWVPGYGISSICSKQQMASQGGGVANLVSWGLLFQLQAYGKSTEIFLMSAGDCQIDILEGSFEEHDAQALLPINQELVLLTLQGHQIMSVLEEAINFVLESNANVGSYPYAGGLRFSINSSASLGQRVSQVEWFSLGQWKTISQEETYQVATTVSLAEGNAGYSTLFNAIERGDTGLLIRDVFIDYARTVEKLENPALEMYSTQEYVPS